MWIPDICLVNGGYNGLQEDEVNSDRNGGGVFLRPLLQIQWALHVYENGTILNVQRCEILFNAIDMCSLRVIFITSNVHRIIIYTTWNFRRSYHIRCFGNAKRFPFDKRSCTLSLETGKGTAYINILWMQSNYFSSNCLT